MAKIIMPDNPMFPVDTATMKAAFQKTRRTKGQSAKKQKIQELHRQERRGWRFIGELTDMLDGMDG